MAVECPDGLFDQVSWCNRRNNLRLQAVFLGMGFCPSVSKSAQMLTFPSCRLVDCGLYWCHGCKLTDISACCVFCQISTTEKEKTD